MMKNDSTVLTSKIVALKGNSVNDFREDVPLL